MVWCSYCAKDQVAEADDINGFTCCTGCGRVLDDNVFSSDPTFTKGADGQSSVQGNFVRDRQYSSYSNVGGEGHQYATDSHERTLEKGRDEIRDIADFLAMSSREDAVNAAHRLYIIAVERNFTRGRRTVQVAAACLYIICRQEQKPFLLIDFSDCLQTNVYVLGAVFLQLCRLLSLEQHPIIQKPVDPSLFIHRFTDRLLRRSSVEGKRNIVAQTALRLVASMKRDWMQTGRRPSGICGAALFISAHIHGFECTKTDVVSVVHICEGTLTKRLIEFENTESGSLTAEEFEVRAEEFHAISQEPQRIACADGKDREVLCEHKAQGAAHYAVGLCKACYDEFIKVSGGMEGGAAPPAFQASERKEAELKKLEEQELLLSASGVPQLKGKKGKLEENLKKKLHDDKTRMMRGKAKEVKGTRKAKEGDDIEITGVYKSELATQASEIIDASKSQDPCDELVLLDLYARPDKVLDVASSCIEDSEAEAEAEKNQDGNPTETFVNNFMNSPELEEADMEDTLSDIDDDEVDGYLHNQEEIRLKTIIWTEMNKDYLEEQQAKQEALAASQAAHAAALAAAGEDSASAIELAAAAAAAVAELRKDRKRKRDEAKSQGPAESATEATRQMLQSKKLSSKVNYSALEKLFDGEGIAEGTQQGSEDEKNKEQSKDKHVKWADMDDTNDLGGKQDTSGTEMHAEGDAIGKDGGEEDEDEEEDAEEDDVAVNMGEDQNYSLPYGDDYDDDGYDEY